MTPNNCKHFTLPCALLIGVQCIEAIEELHSSGYQNISFASYLEGSIDHTYDLLPHRMMILITRESHNYKLNDDQSEIRVFRT